MRTSVVGAVLGARYEALQLLETVALELDADPTRLILLYLLQ